jgi:hypothetical protein
MNQTIARMIRTLTSKIERISNVLKKIFVSVGVFGVFVLVKMEEGDDALIERKKKTIR